MRRTLESSSWATSSGVGGVCGVKIDSYVPFERDELPADRPFTEEHHRDRRVDAFGEAERVGHDGRPSLRVWRELPARPVISLSGMSRRGQGR